jgi:glutathionylspermidine amidase/synthetase
METDLLIGKDLFGVTAYKNVNSDQDHIMNGLYMGLKWQCVEFARRWFVIIFGVYFDKIPNAFDIFELPTVTHIQTNTKLSFRSFKKGIPQVGDLLIFKQSEEFPYGHVSVIVRKNSIHGESYLYLSEQNMGDTMWNGYSRIVRLSDVKDQIKGWKSVH